MLLHPRGEVFRKPLSQLVSPIVPGGVGHCDQCGLRDLSQAHCHATSVELLVVGLKDHRNPFIFLQKKRQFRVVVSSAIQSFIRSVLVFRPIVAVSNRA